jgi:hypothetical protein
VQGLDAAAADGDADPNILQRDTTTRHIGGMNRSLCNSIRNEV